MNKIEMLKKNSAIQSTPEKVKEKQDQEEYFISKKEGLFLVTVFKNKDEMSMRIAKGPTMCTQK